MQLAGGPKKLPKVHPGGPNYLRLGPRDPWATLGPGPDFSQPGPWPRHRGFHQGVGAQIQSHQVLAGASISHLSPCRTCTNHYKCVWASAPDILLDPNILFMTWVLGIENIFMAIVSHLLGLHLAFSVLPMLGNPMPSRLRTHIAESSAHCPTGSLFV